MEGGDVVLRTPSKTDTNNTSADRGARAVWVPQYKKRNACEFIL